MEQAVGEQESSGAGLRVRTGENDEYWLCVQMKNGNMYLLFLLVWADWSHEPEHGGADHV